jgi:hypothetical protein
MDLMALKVLIFSIFFAYLMLEHIARLFIQSLFLEIPEKLPNGLGFSSEF